MCLNVFYNVWMSLRQMCFLPQANAENEQHWHDREGNVLKCCSTKPTYKCTENFHGDWYFIMMVFIPTTSKVQPLPGDHANYVQFWGYLEGQPELINYILFMDEMQLHCDSFTNTRKSHSWSHDIPCKVVCKVTFNTDFQYMHDVE
jgi:hypothetical protein